METEAMTAPDGERRALSMMGPAVVDALMACLGMRLHACAAGRCARSWRGVPRAQTVLPLLGDQDERV